MRGKLKDVKALVFDVFGTVVDWRGSVIAEGRALGRRKKLTVDWPAFADAWRAGYAPTASSSNKSVPPLSITVSAFPIAWRARTSSKDYPTTSSACSTSSSATSRKARPERRYFTIPAGAASVAGRHFCQVLWRACGSSRRSGIFSRWLRTLSTRCAMRDIRAGGKAGTTSWFIN